MFNAHKKFPKIRGFHNVVKEVRSFPIDNVFPVMNFRSKCKLHGTNAGVRVMPDGTVVSQKRSGDCGEYGHFNFPVWVKGNESYFASLAHETDTYIIYGEWAGKGVQKKVAVSELENKSFFVFVVRQLRETDEVDEDGNKIVNSFLIIDPDEIRAIMGDKLPNNIYIVPWHSDDIFIDFNKEADLRNSATKFNDEVSVIDKCDPYIKELFGIEGFGEGLVYYPMPSDDSELTTISTSRFERYSFKIKGASHSGSGDGEKKARVKAVAPDSAYDFANIMLTQDRLNQGIQEVCEDGPVDIKKTGQYIGWVCKDVATEGAQELLRGNLEWKQVQGIIANRAREFFMEKVKEI